MFQKIIDVVNHEQGGMFFLYGYRGTGKTFMWTALSSAFRAEGKIVLTVASSGIASLLLPGGRTTLSKFKIPIPTLEHSVYNITKGSELLDLMKLANLIIWDEAPMAHKYCFETLDRTLKDNMREKNKYDSVFDSKVVVFGGDFRQILHVIPRGSRSDIIHATINSSYLWDHCHILNLKKNIQLLQDELYQYTIAEIEDFSSWIIKIGERWIS